MNNVHGLIYAYHTYPELAELGTHRTGASLPFCGRFRLIDFALSGMMNAGIFDVGIIMQRGYLSLMEHVSGGRPWNMARHSGGVHLLPPYGLPDAGKGSYEGCMEALDAVSSYISGIRAEYILLTRGDLCANVDFRRLIETHLSSGADLTVACTENALRYPHHGFVVGEDGFAEELLCYQQPDGRGVSSLEAYILRREKLLEMVRWSHEGGYLHFHRDALKYMMQQDWRVGVYMHEGYARHITSIADYYEANMDMLDPVKRGQLFPAERRVATRARSDVSTYYSDTAHVTNSLVADGCRIEGDVENCILFGGVKIGAGSTLRDCIVMNDAVIGANAELRCVISDKDVTVSPGVSLAGNQKLPLVIPKGGNI